jgi:hypothetical protein
VRREANTTRTQIHLLVMFIIGVYMSVSRAHYTIILQYWLFVDVSNILAVMSALALIACGAAFYFMHAEMRYFLQVVGRLGNAYCACSHSVCMLANYTVVLFGNWFSAQLCLCATGVS